MSGKSYEASWAKTGNSSGYRLASEFFKENPNFVGAEGGAQVIAADTVVFSLFRDEEEEEAETELMMRLYLDFLSKQALADPNELEEYTAQMAQEDYALMADVTLDSG